MKKLICLMLVVVFASSLLAGCEWGNTSSTMPTTTTTTTQKKIPPSERDPILDEFVLDYTDDFDEYDVEFIKHMYERNLTSFPPVNEYEKPADFCTHMLELNTEENTFYKISVDIENPIYFVAVYNDIGAYILVLGGCVDMVKWRKFNEYEDIPQSIDGEDLVGVYAVYNCVIEKDILNGVDYNYETKYYLPLTNGYEPCNLAYLYGLCESVLWIDIYKIFGRPTTTVILHTLFFVEDMMKEQYEYFIDENGIEYLAMPFNNYEYFSIHAWRFGRHKSEMLPYITKNESLNEYYYENGEITKTKVKYCIPISVIVDICWGK